MRQEIKTQEEWDRISTDSKDISFIINPQEYISIREYKGKSIIVTGKGFVMVEVDGFYRVIDSACLEVSGPSTIEACSSAHIYATNNAFITLYDFADAISTNCCIIAYDKSKVWAKGNSIVEAKGNATIMANECTLVLAREASLVNASGFASVEAIDNSLVYAYGDSHICGYAESTILAYDRAIVSAFENSRVVAFQSSRINAAGNAQVIVMSEKAMVKLSGNARILNPPRTIQEYCNYYGIEIQNGKAVLYKVIHENGSSLHDKNFVYIIGETKHTYCNPSSSFECAEGIHLLPLRLIPEYIYTLSLDISQIKVIRCMVPLDRIVVPQCVLFMRGKVRASEVYVDKEIDLADCGIAGILCKKIKNRPKEYTYV